MGDFCFFAFLIALIALVFLVKKFRAAQEESRRRRILNLVGLVLYAVALLTAAIPVLFLGPAVREASYSSGKGTKVQGGKNG